MNSHLSDAIKSKLTLFVGKNQNLEVKWFLSGGICNTILEALFNIPQTLFKHETIRPLE